MQFFSRFILTHDRREADPDSALAGPRPRQGRGSYGQHLRRGFSSWPRRCGPSLCQPCAANAAAPAATGGAQMPDDQFPVAVVGSVPVVAAPEEIDITNAEALRSALLKEASNGHGTLVVDMTRTRFCDSSGLHALLAVP